MAFKWFDSFCWCVGVCFFLFCFLLKVGLSGSCFLKMGGVVGSLVYIDSVGLILVMISVILYMSLISWWGYMSNRCRVLIFVSVLMSIICYLSANTLLFWVSYELSILPLLLLLIAESPYSERFVGSWYLGGYVVLTSLPMLMCILYLGVVSGGFVFFFPSFMCGGASFLCVAVLCISFITKIPLLPFHSWLPVVHAEAGSPVSVCLSGFIMKLGVLGVFRFGQQVLGGYDFIYFYVALLMLFGVCVFLFSCQELDAKRWLAFLSLSHIVVCVLGLSVGDYTSLLTPFFFCLGHGFSAGLAFLYFWFFYNICGSRNWGVMKCAGGSNNVFRFLSFGVLCTVASFPPTLSFFSELRIFIDSGSVAFFFILVFFIYLFLGGLIPLFILGGCLSMHSSVCLFNGSSFSSVLSLLFLLCFCFLLFFML